MKVISESYFPESPWLSTTQAAFYISCTPGTMKSWRSRGVGPRYHTINGKLVRYLRTDLDLWIMGESNA